MFKLYEVQSIPATYIIDREGYIIAFVSAFRPGPDGVDTRIDEALAVKAGLNGDSIKPAQ